MSEHDDPVGPQQPSDGLPDSPPDGLGETPPDGPHDHTHDDPRGDVVGSAAEEAVKLLGVLGEWARSMREDVDQHLATDAPECTYCPVCRTVHVLREAGPDVRTHLAAATASLMQAGAAVLTSVANSGAPRRAATVQPIDLDGEGDSWEDEQ